MNDGTFHWYTFLFAQVHNPFMFALAIVLAMAAFVAIMFVLHRSPSNIRRWFTVICTFLAGLYFLLEFLLPTRFNPVTERQENLVTPTMDHVLPFMNLVLVWMVFLGIISLIIVHGRRLVKGLPGWHNSLALFIAMLAMIVAGAWSRTGAPDAAPVATMLYKSLFAGLLVNLDAAMFSLLAFYIASAAYRAFRIRTVEAALLMFSALIVMLGMINFGVLLTNGIPTDSPWAFFRIERFASWLLTTINMPAQRAITIGVAVGALAMAMRLWLSLERGAFFSQEK